MKTQGPAMKFPSREWPKNSRRSTWGLPAQVRGGHADAKKTLCRKGYRRPAEQVRRCLD
jgi:hypothetical protein